MTNKDSAPYWLRTQLGSVPPGVNLVREISIGYLDASPAIIKTGPFSVAFAGVSSPGSVRISKAYDAVNKLDVYTLEASRPLGFYGIRLEVNGYQEWYSRDKINTEIERFFWGIASFDIDNACVKQTSLKQARQIILVPELIGVVNSSLNVTEGTDLRLAFKSILPSRLSGYVLYEKLTAAVTFYGITEEWSGSWNG